jgi:hypothetical protein
MLVQHRVTLGWRRLTLPRCVMALLGRADPKCSTSKGRAPPRPHRLRRETLPRSTGWLWLGGVDRVATAHPSAAASGISSTTSGALCNTLTVCAPKAAHYPLLLFGSARAASTELRNAWRSSRQPTGMLEDRGQLRHKFRLAVYRGRISLVFPLSSLRDDARRRAIRFAGVAT